MGVSAEYIVIGGGEWGCYHTELLLRAMDNGRLEPGVVRSVDRNPGCEVAARFGSEERFRFTPAEWVPFLVRHVTREAAAAGSHVVPSPHAPHLFLDWLEAYLRRSHPRSLLQRLPFQAELSLPFQYADEAGNLYLSAAAWRCPLSCREPAICPAIRARRSWELADIIRARAESRSSPMVPVVWRTEYVCPGIAAVRVRDLLQAADRLDGSVRGRAAVATVSACHGVVGMLDYQLAPEDRKCV